MPGRSMLIGFALLLVSALSSYGNQVIDFSKDIRPILEANCVACHGPEKAKGKLRLDTAAGIRRGGDSGEPLFIPGQRKQSFLYKLVSREDPEEAMPPETEESLSPEEVERIGLWIDQGADLPGHGEVVRLTTDHWSFQPVEREHAYEDVDDYLRVALNGKGLRFSARADRRTLIRRLYLVMLGLPPSPEEVEAFLQDESPGAWPALVDRVLASPHYGERMARHWLDLVRFAETNGFETNRERLTAYHFRDYVIESFNEDTPYDQLIREHLAGDRMGRPVGTGFLVAGPHDIVKSPDQNLTLMQRQDELADMINTTGTAFLGMTVGCARCHNHKFDPILQKDYYAMQAVFAGVGFGERKLPGRTGPGANEKLALIRKNHDGLVREFDELRRKGEAVPAGKSEGGGRPAVNSKVNIERFEPREAKHVRFEILRTNGGEPCIDELVVFSTGDRNVAGGGKATASGSLPGYEIHKLEHINDGRFGNSRSWISNSPGSGWIQIEFSELHEVDRIEWGRDRKGKFKDRLAIEYRIYLSEDGRNWKTVADHRSRKRYGGTNPDPDAFLALLSPADEKRGRFLKAEITRLGQRMAELSGGIKAWVAGFSQPGPTYRLYRGDPMARREEVGPDALPVISSLGLERSASEGERRESLADWIASPANPLTARVAVNRLWQYVYGIGLVDTPSDFGANGTRPTHPALLDWLAAEFVEGGWSVKALLRTLLTSDAFQQASFPDRNAERVDADSRFLWRFPPRRMEAEVIRDGILLAAGTLDRRMGGPGFYLLDVERENVVHYHAREDLGPPEWRRMVYMFKIRQEQDLVFGAFDCPDGNQVVPKRNRSTTPLQALNLLNSKFIMQQAVKMAGRLGDGEQGIRRAFEILYCRPAQEDELADAVGFVAEHGMEAFCRAMLNTNEFLFVF